MKNTAFTRKMVALLLVTVLILSASATAYADYTPLSNEWKTRVSSFTRVSITHSPTSGCVKVLQRFLSCYNNTSRSYIYNAGGVDGIFGQGTDNAVRAFQTARYIGVDGDCGSTTWGEIADCIFKTYWVSVGADLFMTNDQCPYGAECDVMYVHINSPYSYSYYTFDYYGNSLGFAFQTT